MAASQERTALDGLEKKMVTLMSTGATKSRWAEWLQAPLELALAAGDKRLALALLKAGDDGSAGLVGLNGRSLLGAAVEGGNHELVNAVLEAGGSEEVDTGSGPDNMTALHLAAIGGHTKTARALMLAGAQVGALDRRRRTVLHYAVEGGHLPLVKNVMAGGVDLNVGDDDGDTALHIASAQGDEAIVTALIREGACVIATNRRRRPPLHAAVEGDHVAVAGALLKAGADPDALYDDGRSPLFVARSSLAMTRALLKSGARVTIKDKSYGFTALHLVARYGEGDVVHALVDAGANVSARSCSRGSRHNSHRYITPLHNAARGCNLGTMSALLRHGADVNAIDMHGETSLHWVCKSKDNTYSADAADLLLRRSVGSAKPARPKPVVIMAAGVEVAVAAAVRVVSGEAAMS
eukprot:g8306.t1